MLRAELAGGVEREEQRSDQEQGEHQNELRRDVGTVCVKLGA
jgi:hypothetical protein